MLRSRKRLWLLALLPVVGLGWAMKSAVSWRPQVFGVQKNVASVQISPDGKLLLVADSRHRGEAWDVHTGRPLWKLNGYSFTFSPDGRAAVQVHQLVEQGPDPNLTNPNAIVLDVWEARTRKLIRSLTDPKPRILLKLPRPYPDIDQMFDYGFSSDGSVFLLATEDFLRKWDMRTGRLLSVRHWQVASAPTIVKDAVLSRDGRTVVAAAGDVGLFDTETAC